MARTGLRLLALAPISTVLYGIGRWGADQTGWAHTLLPWPAVLIFLVVFMGGWLGIPVTGALATVLLHEFNPTWQRRIKRVFVGWVFAWIGVAVAVGLWGTPLTFA